MRNVLRRGDRAQEARELLKLCLTHDPLKDTPTQPRHFSSSKLFSECNFARYGDLIGRHTPFKEVRQFLNILKIHESEGILAVKYRIDAKAQ